MDTHKTDSRVQKTDKAIRDAVCLLLRDIPPDRLTLKAISSKSHVSMNVIRARATSPEGLLRYIGSDIEREFRQRRSIQTDELGVGNSVGDFFMR